MHCATNANGDTSCIHMYHVGWPIIAVAVIIALLIVLGVIRYHG
jgi:hypothetical protein